MNNQLWKIRKNKLNRTNLFLYSNYIKKNFKIDTGYDFIIPKSNINNTINKIKFSLKKCQKI